MSEKIISRAPVGMARNVMDGFNSTADLNEVLIFDTETTTDYSQTLRVGGFILRNRLNRKIRDFGFFVSNDLSKSDLKTVIDYCAGFSDRLDKIIGDQKRISASEKRASADDIDAAFSELKEWISRRKKPVLLSRKDFTSLMLDVIQDKWTVHKNTGGHCAVAGLNLLFDMGAIATPVSADHKRYTHSPIYAWGHDSEIRGKGFSFSLCECAERVFTPVSGKSSKNYAGDKFEGSEIHVRCPHHPNIETRNLGGRKNQYGLSSGSSGPVLDMSVIGRALLGPGDASLRGLGERMGAKILKRKGETGHGENISPDYMDYLVIDVLASAEIFELQIKRYFEHGMHAPITSIFSEASVGKAYFDAFGIQGDITNREFRALDNSESFNKRDFMAAAQEAYRGGRSEVRERLTVCDIAACDFKSQYPSVNAMMGLQALLIARDYSVIQGWTAIERARSVLEIASHDWLNDLDNWKRIRIIVKIKIAGTILPQKWKSANGKTPYGYRQADLKSTAEAWYPLADLIASKLFTSGHIPEIIDAYEIIPGAQMKTEIRKLFGRDDMTIDLRKDDLFTRLIDVRAEVKIAMKSIEANSPEYLVSDNLQNNLKLIANATSYGVLAETRMEGKAKKAREVSGKYYAPFIAAHITGGSRLLLAIAQTLARDIGARDLGTPVLHAMCDTDSMVFIRPDKISIEKFESVISQVTGYFEALSPYASDKNLFVRENDKPGADGTTKFFGVSCKRYVIFNVAENNDINLIKVSSHGLGPYRFDDDVQCDGISAERNPADSDDDGTFDDTAETDDESTEDYGEIANPDAKSKWRRYQAFIWTRGIQRALKTRPVASNERKLHNGFPIENWSKSITRLPQSVTTPGKLLEYSKLGVRPGSFFLTFPRREKSKIRMAAPMAMTGQDAITGDCRDIYTGEKLAPQLILKNVTPLYEALQFYLVNPERKSKGVGIDRGDYQQSPGRLGLHVAMIDDIDRRNRKGQALSALQAELFDD